MSEGIPLAAPDVTEAEIAAVTAVLRRSQLSLGRELEGFEAELAAYHGLADAVAVSSGTAGLHLALVALGVGVGDEVLVPSFAFVAVANVVLQVGARPVFVEIDEATLNVDPECVERAVTRRTRAMIVVHTFGVPAEMDALRRIAERHGLVIVEDACEAIGAEFGEGCVRRRVGGLGELGVLGFYPNKQMTTGEGGAVLCANVAHARRLRSLRNQGREHESGSGAADWLDHAEPGYNYRLSEMACALGRVQLRRLDGMLTRRAELARLYDALLKDVDEVERPRLEFAGRTVSWFVYAVRLPSGVDRDAMQQQMAERGVATGRYFPPIHLQPAWRNRAAAQVSLPRTEAVARRMLALPLFNRLEASQQDAVVDALRESLAEQRAAGCGVEAKWSRSRGERE